MGIVLRGLFYVKYVSMVKLKIKKQLIAVYPGAINFMVTIHLKTVLNANWLIYLTGLRNNLILICNCNSFSTEFLMCVQNS